jgi:asparaginyl-tRNA synthetase
MIKKEGSDEFTPIAKAALKKLQKNYDAHTKKAKKAEAAAASVVAHVEEEDIVEDPSLPRAERIKIRQGGEKRGIRVVIRGWVATVRVQSRKLVFVDLRDGSDLVLQCVLAGALVFP